MNKIKRVGFDLDGVILYNPIRMFRPVVAFGKKYILKKADVKFYVPSHAVTNILWRLVHKTSLFVAPGFREILQHLKKNRIEVYVITSRFHTLEKDFKHWMALIDAKNNLKGYYNNPHDEQPHKFKKRMIQELKLDVFIDDNWDIVSYLSKEFSATDKKILWITNLLDNHIPYRHKFSSMKQVAKYLKSITS